VNDKALVTQRADIAQDRPARGAHFIGQFIHGAGAVAAQVADDGVMSVSNVHFGIITQKVTNYGTNKV